ncbi:MAG: glycosyltransferase family 2 protein [Chitinophagaceae bacterium]|nr:glycosyltransferase family 2 protein [Chitinophagaceae bacterium]
MQPALSIILVNYHSGAFMYNCVQSIVQETAGVEYEIILIDNSLQDGAANRLLQSFPQIRYQALPANEGFARANNAGIAMAKSETVLLLNTDTIIRQNAIGHCFERLQQKDELIAAGVQLEYADGSPQVSGSFNLTGGLNFLMAIPYFGRVLRWLSMQIGVKKPSIAEAVSATEVDWISGAFLMVKMSAIRKAGPLDSDFFLYHEESEWCGRLQQFGKLCLYGDLRVTHLEGASANTAFQSKTNAYSNLSDKKGFQLLLSMMVRIRKQFGLHWFLLHLSIHLLASIMGLPIAFLHSFLGGFNQLKQTWGYTKNVWRLLPFVITIIQKQPFFYKVL